MLFRKEKKLKKGEFIKKLGDLLFDNTGCLYGKFSPAELYAYYYNWPYLSTVIKSDAVIELISLQELFGYFSDSQLSDSMFLVHKDDGLFRKPNPSLNWMEKVANISEKFYFCDLVNSLDKRMTILLGRHDGYSRMFTVYRVLVYMPLKKDSILAIQNLDLNTLQKFIERYPGFISNISQNDNVFTKSEQFEKLDFTKDLIITTTKKISPDSTYPIKIFYTPE